MTSLVAHDPVQTVAAGGIASLSAKIAPHAAGLDQRTSPVTARAYTHPALAPGKVVVRLEPEAVAAGVDAEMTAFGFDAPSVSKPLGQVRYRTLGFPAWALVHQPKHAKAALEVTEDMRKAKRLVAAKPGHAKEAFEAIAKRLQRSAPQFLPSFWEEVGRVVADQASTAMAAQCFERARQAERAFKLASDPEDSDAVFVEFALLGALSAKTLTAYAKDLARTAGGAEAYRRFRAIVVKRALGGMPPYSGMGKDLASLAAGAKLPADAEADALFAELVEAPGVGKAPAEFWTTYRASIVRAGTARPELRARLRHVWPAPRGGSDDARTAFKQTWLALLDEIGALRDLPEDGLGAWLSRLIAFAGKTPLVEAVLRREAERLVRTGQKLAVVFEGRLHLDLAELALELGVTLAEPGEYESFDWDTITCDPVRVAAHPVYGKQLVEIVGHGMGQAEQEAKMRGKAGFVAARRRWVEEQLAGLGGSLASARLALEAFERQTTAETFLPMADLHARLAETSLAPALAAQLAAGTADEFTWPAYEQAAASLGTPVKHGGAFPVLVIWNAARAIALGATGVIAEHDLVYKAKQHTLEEVWFLDGQFLVELREKDGWKTVQYWSGRPKERFEAKGSPSSWYGQLPNQWSPAGGGVTLGYKRFFAGDAEVTGSRDFLTDGTAMWIDEYGKLSAFDPIKGTKGKPEAPPFLRAFERAGFEVTGVLVPAPPGLASSPLGLRDGLLGLRRRAKAEDWDRQVPIEHERIDGVTWSGSLAAFALVTFPGDARPRPISTAEAKGPRFLDGEGAGVGLHHPDTGQQTCVLNDDAWASRGWGDVLVPPAAFWDYLTPRDPAGSAALRSITTAQAAALLEAARRDVDAGGDDTGRPMPETLAAIARVLPAITSEALARGVAGLAERAAELARQLADVAAQRAKEHADPGGQGLLGPAAQLRKLATALAAGRPMKLPDFELDPREWLVHARARVALSLSPIATEDARRQAREIVRALAGTILAEDLSRLRLLSISAPDDYEDPNDWDTLVIQKHEGSVFAIHASSDWAIELSTDGELRVPPVAGTKLAWKIEDAKRLGRGIGTAWADRFLEQPDAPVPWDPAIASALAERAGLSVPEAILLWIDPTKLPSWQKDFLGKPHRELLGLKVQEAGAARTTFSELEDEQLYALYDKAVPEDPALLRTPLAPGGFVERLGAAWKARFGKRAKIPQDLVAAAKKDLTFDDDLGKLLPVFAGGADDAKFLAPDLRPLPELGGWGDDHGLTGSRAGELAQLVSWLFLARPVGCPIRAGIPDVVARLSAVLDEPKLVWPFDSQWLDDDDPKQVARGRRVVEAVGGKPVKLPADDGDPCLAAADDGVCIAGLYKTHVYAGFRPSKLDAKSRKKVAQLAALMVDPDLGESDGLEEVQRVELLRSEGFRAFAARVAETPVPEGGYEANPAASVPKLVAKVAAKLGISEPAAALYLQTLALAEPTTARVQLWNGWKPKQYKDAAAELVKKKLVVEGKRERAGRTIFLKGGYSKGRGKDLPMEDWKLPLYSGLDRHLPAEPCHLLFARAWKRVEDGDKP